ncbi:hypothetical protein BDC45DRAFT_533844 [Circinella umbellata]|nr:hypothetical protein BDC45DRAFT_533840 [Circinella umbellata]KAI7856421.1 hypothetical protein BDC45DRAFT_533844 [Circinella umbellata]
MALKKKSFLSSPHLNSKKEICDLFLRDFLVNFNEVHRWESFTRANYEASQKKRKTQHNSDQKEVTKATRKISMELLDDVREDKVVHTKKYINDQTDVQLSGKDLESLILLAQNNILNLSDRSIKGQWKMFLKTQ